MSYYYLIASLPDLSLSMDHQKIDFEKTFELIRSNLTPNDGQLYRYLLYPNDIRNMLSVLFHEYQDLPSMPLRQPAALSEEEVRGYKHSKGNFPDFMNDFLVENEDLFPTMTMREMESLLMAKFHEELTFRADGFIAEYFTFFSQVKSLVAAFNFNAFDFLSEPDTSDVERLIGQIGPERSPTAAITKDYPYSEELIKALSEGKPSNSEQFIDRILWDFLDEKNKGFFSNEEVFAYTVKLQMAYRWSRLDAQQGSDRFEKLNDEIKNNVRSPKIPVI